MNRFRATALLVAVFVAPALHAEPPTVAASSSPAVTAGLLENIPIVLPKTSPPKAMVLYLSDRSGWKATDDAAVAALASAGNVVLKVDFAGYADKLDKGDGECADVVGDIVDAAQTAQRQLEIQTYLPPIVVGAGEAATFAYAALSAALPNTLGGAVGVGFDNRLSLRFPICSAAKASKTHDGKAFQYGFDKALPGSVSLLVAPDATDAFEKLAAPQSDDVDIIAIDPATLPQQIAREVEDMASVARPFGDLPAIDLPSFTTPPRALAILVSGDGGWRDLDKTMGEWLSTQGVHVVGLDALHYFWSKRTPADLAKDIAFLVDAADATDALPIMLIGYSFGADTIPFAFPLLPKAVQDRTRVLALLAPGKSTSFQVTISGWLGIDDSGYNVTPAVAALPADRVVCVYGEEDDDSACANASVRAATIVKTTGGHHFDGNYTGIAQRFLDRLAKH
jgi:type IV secretory pathway VirJ component